MAEASAGDLNPAGTVDVGHHADTWSLTERWPDVKALLAAVLEVPVAERESFLDENCNHGALRSEIESLLQYDSGTSVVPGRSGEALPPEMTVSPGDRIGPYCVLRTLGRGGMGEVYLATRQVDFHQPVAIKLLRRSLREDDVQRFQRERQLLADLDHPGIARLLDGGSTEYGAPYMVMEWIDGEPLDRAADRLQLGIRQRVELFLEVCDAIAYAHRRLIIHRDVKPENILLPAEGGPKLLDFGIAKLLQPSDSQSGSRDTGGGPRPLTPRYASPEQWAGQPLTTASDLYSAALVLAELLVGPFDIEPSRRAERLQGVLTARLRGNDLDDSELHAIAAKRGAKSAALLSGVRGDLEAILRRALEPAPEDRYAGVESFAEDLQRWLHGYPVNARRTGPARHVLKLVRRRPWTSALASVALAAILGLSGVSQWQSHRLADEVERSEQRAREALAAQERSDRLNLALVDLFDVDDLRRRGLEASEARLLLDQGIEVAETRFAEDPVTLVQARTLFARAFKRLGSLDRAEEGFRSAAALADSLGEQVPAAQRLEIQLEMGDIALDRRDYARAAALLGQGQEFADRRADLGVEERSELLRAWGYALWRSDDRPAARRAIRDAYEMRVEAFGASDLRTAELVPYYVVIQEVSYPQAVELLEAALDVHQRHYGPLSEENVVFYSALRETHLFHGRLDSARDAALEELEILRLRRGDVHPQIHGVGLRLASIESLRGDLDAALEQLEQVDAVGRALPDENPALRIRRAEIRAVVLVRAGRLDEAAELFRWTLEQYVKEFGPEHPDAFLTRGNLASTLSRSGRCAEAVPLAEEALQGLQRDVAVKAGNTPALVALARCALDGGDAERARDFLDRVAEGNRRIGLPESHPTVREVQKLYALLQVDSPDA